MTVPQAEELLNDMRTADLSGTSYGTEVQLEEQNQKDPKEIGLKKFTVGFYRYYNNHARDRIQGATLKANEILRKSQMQASAEDDEEGDKDEEDEEDEIAEWIADDHQKDVYVSPSHPPVVWNASRPSRRVVGDPSPRSPRSDADAGPLRRSRRS